MELIKEKPGDLYSIHAGLRLSEDLERQTTPTASISTAGKIWTVHSQRGGRLDTTNGS